MKISNNLITGSDENGVLIQTAYYPTIIGNTIKTNVKNGIRFENHGVGLITNNMIIENDSGNTGTYSGVILTAASWCTISNNHVHYNDNYGIDISAAGCSNTTVTGNRVSGNTNGDVNDAGTNTLPNGAMGTNNLELDDLNIIG